MILWKFKEIPEVRGASFPCSAFRWILDVGISYIEFARQHKWRDIGEWATSHVLRYGICLTKTFRMGSCHLYYDGPHCSFSFGFIDFYWAGGLITGRCKKCMPDD